MPEQGEDVKFRCACGRSHMHDAQYGRGPGRGGVPEASQPDMASPVYVPAIGDRVRRVGRSSPVGRVELGPFLSLYPRRPGELVMKVAWFGTADAPLPDGVWSWEDVERLEPVERIDWPKLDPIGGIDA